MATRLKDMTTEEILGMFDRRWSRERNHRKMLEKRLEVLEEFLDGAKVTKGLKWTQYAKPTDEQKIVPEVEG